MADTRRCIGSTRYGIEPHEAPVEDFPKQPSQKDGLARMCRPHWNQYTAGLARDRKARAVAEGEGPVAVERLRASAKAAGAKVKVTRVAKPRKARQPIEVRPGVFEIGVGEYVHAAPEEVA